jgi:hypothetical protein
MGGGCGLCSLLTTVLISRELFGSDLIFFFVLCVVLLDHQFVISRRMPPAPTRELDTILTNAAPEKEEKMSHGGDVHFLMRR